MSGFGGFGSPPQTGGGGFGFGQQQQQQQHTQPTFGSPPVAAPPGGSGFNNSPFGSGGGGGFGNPPAAATAFAAPASFAPAPSTGFGSSAMGAPTAFAAPSSSFGNPSSGFGQSSSFGNNNNINNNNNNSGFGSPFGSSQPQNNQPQNQPMNVPNPFGSAAAAAPAMSFGSSSNVVMTSSASSFTNRGGAGMTFAAPASSFSSGFGNTASSNAGAAAPGFGSAPFGSAPAPSSSNHFGGNHGRSSAAPATSSSNHFGGNHGRSSGGMSFAAPASAGHNRGNSVDMGGSDSPAPMMAFGGTFHSTNFNSDGNLSPIPEDSMGDPFGGGNQSNDKRSDKQGRNDGSGNEQEDLAKLKAKLEAKKKRLEAAKLKKKNQGGSDNVSDKVVESTRPQKQSSQDRRNERSRSSSPMPLNDEQQARAARNAARFATNQNSSTQQHMPSELKGMTQAPKPSVTSALGGEANREDLANAKSLVGTCTFMCPDEELLRRERENDIQLLEIPDPGGIHPPNWTLRQTAVKRFRRSAADYKLDVPEWVRPPDVLEECCAYLEEWVMERDRQGPDRRFPQNATPNSLDVYQFIWDRTRMIRKDFILQNYVGTGGNCDARAVRCHERIARWHAMCEHQLSHLGDFVIKQSQQNIQELGQAMKTLNQYYDDSLGRATVEVADDEGRETRHNASDFSHGCSSDAVQGGNPVDYDGSPLNNTPDTSKLPSQRLIGGGNVNSPTRGTAEPEMRGLYIILTMNNDGGMEVMRYSAALYKNRPEIYHSKPVQLALEIFKAKKDFNYARFFSILRDPKTPYLFACLMFKHIELMRKCAFQIMHKTYGTRKQGDPIYDAYPLKRLAHLLCFEDMDEARDACKHYNIKVKEMKVRSSTTGQSGVQEIIFWKASDFREPTDPEKGHILPLRPKKLLRCIESKLKGATRLGICRGEVSGEGASLSQLPTSREPQVAPVPPARPQATSPKPATIPSTSSALPEDSAPSPEELGKAAKEKEHEHAMRAEYERKKAEKLRLFEKKKEEEKKRQIEEQKRQQEERAREAEEKKLEAERHKQERREREEKERAETAAKEAARQKQELERRRKLEEARLRAEAERQEQERLEALRKEEEERRRQVELKEAEERRQKEIKAAEERRRREEAERIRIEKERQRLEALKAQEEERKRQEALARKAAQELEERINQARKQILCRRWKQQLSRHFLSLQQTQNTLNRIDPNFCLTSPVSGDLIDEGLHALRSSCPRSEPGWRKILNQILSREVYSLDVASMTLKVLCSDDELMEHVKSRRYRSVAVGNTVKATFLLNVAVILPEPSSLDEPNGSGLAECSMYEAIHTWLNRRLEYGRTDTLERQDPTGKLKVEIRVHFAKRDSWAGSISCDAAMVVVPPAFCSGDWSCSRKVDSISAAFNCVDEDTPRVALVLGESFDSEYYSEFNQFLAACIPTDSEEFPVIFPSALSESALEASLATSLRSLISVYNAEFPPLVEQASIVKMASRCISDTLWRNSGQGPLESAIAALIELAKELDRAGEAVSSAWSSWPAEDLANERGLVPDYFAEGIHLPTSWSSPIFQDAAKNKLQYLRSLMEGNNIGSAIDRLLVKAPSRIRNECDDFLEMRQYRKCLQRALEYASLNDETTFYLPKGISERMVAGCIETVLGNTDNFAAGRLLNGEAESDGVLEFDVDNNLDDEKEAVEGEAMENEVQSSSNSAFEAVNRPRSDDQGVFQKARDIFAASRTISPVPLPAGGMPLRARTPPPPPGTESPHLGVSSGNKRSWIGMSFAEDEDQFDGGISPLRSPQGSTTGSALKRARSAANTSQQKPNRTRDQIDSSAFTQKLQALLSGEATVDCEVGDSTLSSLVRGVPLLNGNNLVEEIE